MAKKNNGNYRNSNNQRGGKKGKPKFSELERLAFNLGKVQAGLAKDTLVKDSYENGKKAATEGPKKQKPLC